MDSSDLVQTTSHENPDFRLTRLILIDSYARGRSVEIDLAGHTSLTGENASGKTTLLRLFPLFFGEAPSKVITTDENNFKFAKHYFPTQASYVIFEYERRGARVLSVIHPEGQSDSVCYRFIDSPYRPELFRDGLGLIQSSELTRHLTKLGVEHTRPLSLTLYRQILQNEAGREHRQLASRFAFTGSGGRLKHIERIVSSILLRATSFYDLKRMIVSSVQESTEAFSLRTNKRELTQWIAEYEAHNAVMGKASIMEELELADQQRRHAVDEFSTLHASFQLIHDHYHAEILAGEAEEDRLRNLRNQKLSDYSSQSIALMEQVNAEVAKINSINGTIRALDTHKRQYDTEKAEARAAMVDGLAEMQTRLTGQQSRLAELEASSKSVVEVFDKLELDARADADQNTRQLETRKTGLVQGFAAKQSEMFGRHTEQQKLVTARHRTELASLTANAATIGVERARLETVAKHPAPDPEAQQAYDLELEAVQEASRRVDALRVGFEPLERKLDKAGRSFADEEAMLNGSRGALEKAELDLQDIVAAGSAGEETLLGFLRANKPDWAQDIGRLISEETLMRSDLAPVLSGGDDLFGVSLDLEQLEASRLSSEESIQQEIGRLRALVDKRQKQVDEDQRKLNEAGRHRNHAKEARDAHQLQLEQAIAAKAAADQRMNTARTRWMASKEAARRSAQAALEVCQKAHDVAKTAVTDADKRHAAELSEREQAHAAERAALTSTHAQEIAAIDLALQGIAQQLATRLEDIARQRNEALRANGVDTAVLDPIRTEIGELKKKIENASNDRTYVSAYRTWLEVSWAKRSQHEAERDTAQSVKDALAGKHSDLMRQRDADLAAHDRLAKDVADAIEKATKSLRDAKGQLTNLSGWPQDKATLDAGFDNRISVELLASRRRELSGVYAELQKRIEEGVDDIRKQMISSPGSGPERYHANALQRIGHPQPSQAYLWIEGLRGWYQHEHAQNKAHLIQMGKTMAQSISAFWSGLGNFKKQVGNFAADLKAHLHQGQVFANIADVSVIITTDVEKQGYWQAIESLHNEYDSWHVLGDALPPPSFVTAAREVAMVLSDDKGLVADPVDLINLQVTANIDGDGSKVAKNEAALVRMSSNGLSYIILVVIMIGFINRIRRKERVAVPFVVDELKDLSVVNATALLNLLARNNITMISAFPDVDPDLAPLFAKNYKILPGRTLATVKLEAEEDVHA